MKTQIKPIAIAVALALGGGASVAGAQTVAPAATPVEELAPVVVTGVRASLQASIEAKREADSVVEVITAEDIGKMPDKNIADSLARVSGVTISSAGASEGGFDENDRVSMRGTNPSLTQTLLNGHNVAAGDWFVLNQTGTVGRSVSYTLLPSELVSQVVVHKSSEASLVEGGVAGTVDIITRKPLDFDKAVTVEASVGVVKASLPGNTDPQLSGLVAVQNESRTVGIMLQAFSEKRHLRRDGTELLGYDTIAATSAIATSHPDLAGVQYPTLIGAALFEQKRERTGGLLDLQWKPSNDMNFDLSGFVSNLKAPNYNRNYMLWNTHYIGSGAGQAPDPGYVVSNNTLVKANFTGQAGTFYGVYDQISRPDESESTNFINLDANWRYSDRLKFSGQIGTSRGEGQTPTQNVSETLPGVGAGAGWQLNGLGSGPNFNLGTANNTTPFPGGTPVDFGWIFGAQNVDVKDKEDWIKLDGTLRFEGGALADLRFGYRYETHDRNSAGAIAQGPTFAPNGGGTSTANYPSSWSNYPGNYTGFGGSTPTGMWYWTPDQLATYNGPGLVQRDPLARAYPDFWFGLKEKNNAAYVQADFSGTGWSGNLGLRLVRTQEDTTLYEQDSTITASTPGAVTTSLFGPYVSYNISHSYNDVLPSANLKIDLAKDLVTRFALSQTMTRADYSALAGPTSLGTPPAGSTGNPDLKPIRSTNLDAGIEWYFAKQSMVSATLFYMDLRNFISYGTLPLTALTIGALNPTGQNQNYLLTVPINSTGRVAGLELAYQQALTKNFGVNANYTYANGRQTSDVTNGDDRLVGTSKNSYNLSGYFENETLSARITYTYRSAFYAGLDRSTAFTQDAVGTLGASFGYAFNKNLGLTLDGMNLNAPVLKYYALNETQPRAFYQNGRQYYLNLRYKF
jgi:iron complex outermembrane receptor protein